MKIVGASVRKFRDTPEIQINDGTVIETYRDSSFPEVAELWNPRGSAFQILEME